MLYVFKGEELKSLYEDVIFPVDDFFDQWDPSAATSIEEICDLQELLY